MWYLNFNRVEDDNIQLQKESIKELETTDASTSAYTDPIRKTLIYMKMTPDKNRNIHIQLVKKSTFKISKTKLATNVYNIIP